MPLSLSSVNEGKELGINLTSGGDGRLGSTRSGSRLGLSADCGTPAEVKESRNSSGLQ